MTYTKGDNVKSLRFICLMKILIDSPVRRFTGFISNMR